MDFSNKTVIVTGGTRGLGGGITKSFLESGATVIATYAGNDAAAKEFAQSLPEYSAKLIIRKFDVASYVAAEEFFAEVDELTGEDGIQILVNNAGIRRDAIVGMMSSTDWQAVINTNLTGTFNMSKLAVLRFIRNKYGRIINITSPSGRFGFEGQANYAASKAGQVAFTRSLSKEVGKRGITVNCVSPGFLNTEFLDNVPDKLKEQYRKDVPLKRFGEVSEVAECVLFLASDKASYVSGATLEVSGGL